MGNGNTARSKILSIFTKKESREWLQSCSYYRELIHRLTQFDVDFVCGEDHRRVLVGGRRWCEPCVGRRRIPRVTDGLDEVQLAISLHFVAQPVHQHTRPWCLVQRGTEEDIWNWAEFSQINRRFVGRRGVRTGHTCHPHHVLEGHSSYRLISKTWKLGKNFKSFSNTVCIKE